MSFGAMTMWGTKRGMRLTALAVCAAGVAAAAVVPWSKTVQAQAAATPDPASAEYYAQVVQPIFQNNCYRCHGGMNHRGGLKMDTRTDLLRGGKDGSVLTPGHPEQSLLIALIRHEGPADDPMPMPPKSKLADADVAAVTAWVKAGAVMPEK